MTFLLLNYVFITDPLMPPNPFTALLQETLPFANYPNGMSNKLETIAHRENLQELI